MDPQLPVLDPAPLAVDLVERYVRAFLWFVLAAGLAWLLGIETIYAHITPWYARYAPHLPTVLVPGGLISAGWGAWLVWNARRGRHPLGDVAWGAGGWLLVTLVFAAVWGHQTRATGSGLLAGLGTEAPLLGRHLLALACAVGFYAAVSWMLSRRGWPERPIDTRTLVMLLAGTAVFLFVFSGLVASMRSGMDGIAMAYSRTRLEYISDIGKGGSLRGLFANYLDMLPYLSMHSKVHPPGPIALLWIMSYGVGHGPLALSLTTMAFASTAIIILYFWTRDVFGEAAAVMAVLLYPVVPSFVLFTATSADAAFVPFVLLTLFLFWRALHRSPLRYALPAGVVYGMCSLLSFNLLTLGAFFGAVGLWRLREPEHRAKVVETAIIMLFGLGALHLAVHLWSGFDVFACFRANLNQFNLDQYALDLQQPRYPWYVYKVTNPLAILFFAGVPCVVLCAMALRTREYAQAACVFAGSFLIMTLFYVARGEAERSAMYTIPFVLLPAAAILGRITTRGASWLPALVTAGFMAVQSWFIESFFFVYW